MKEIKDYDVKIDRHQSGHKIRRRDEKYEGKGIRDKETVAF